MALNPQELLYCETHEWVHVADNDGAKVATIGVSQFAVKQLSDVCGLELPDVGTQLASGDEFGEIESVKAVSQLYSPVTGEVIDVNSGLEDDYAKMNDDPYGAGWIIKVKLTDETSLASLMDLAAYEAQCETEG